MVAVGAVAMMLPMAALAQAAAKSSGARRAAGSSLPMAPAAKQSAAAAGAPAAMTFPAPNPKFFTAATPTVDEVNAFLKQLWGYDENRVWSVMGILKTEVPGVSRVVVFIGDKTQPGKTQRTVFFTMPDGKHAIADTVIDFGATPFADKRKMLQERADGPARGAAGKELLLVEFSDLQCPHCKDAQPVMDQLATDFPQARVVFQNYPLMEIHPFAFEAAAEGLCVRKAKGDEGFFKYAQAVFDAQGGLTAEGAAQVLSNAASKAGADGAAMAVCAKTQATRDAVNASVKTAQELGLESTPTLYVNGQPVPVTNVPYEVLKKIVAFRANQDGVPVTLQPSLKTLK